MPRLFTMAKSTVFNLIRIFKSSVSAVLPENIMKDTVKYNHNSKELNIDGISVSLLNRNVYLVGTGKAVQDMALKVDQILGPKIKQGIISIPTGSLHYNARNGNVMYYEGARNNLPDANAQATAIKVKTMISQLSDTDILIVLISGGGSALLPLPKEPMTLEDKTDVIKLLANAGADITELNTVRKKLSQIKGGQLAIMAQPADVISLILSDIVGDPLDMIASGPTSENKDHPNAAIDIIKKYNLYDQLPNSTKIILKNVEDHKLFPNHKVKNLIIGSNKLSINAAVNECKAMDFSSIALTNIVTGNVRDIAQKYVKLSKIFCDFILKDLSKNSLKEKLLCLDIPGVNECLDNIDGLDVSKKNICLILGGEITVEVKGQGKGGRNQQLALEFSNYIHKIKDNFKDFEVYLLSAGTDGIDGPTDAAGAIGYIELVSDAMKENIIINEYINNNDTYNFYKIFKKGLMHVITGHTNTNVMDIHIILIIKKSTI
ncbi:unnamed protein product [Diatraea saccharalis]|uniref:Glycerate kinase n=1 Tax=Diatraea saccharalis TaxID=40085 RepID=A0A9N9RDP5_9NEOP|nr:unnamed protein product [Diatraea saccharalis]